MEGVSVVLVDTRVENVSVVLVDTRVEEDEVVLGSISLVHELEPFKFPPLFNSYWLDVKRTILSVSSGEEHVHIVPL